MLAAGASNAMECAAAALPTIVTVVAAGVPTVSAPPSASNITAPNRTVKSSSSSANRSAAMFSTMVAVVAPLSMVTLRPLAGVVTVTSGVCASLSAPVLAEVIASSENATVAVPADAPDSVTTKVTAVPSFTCTPLASASTSVPVAGAMVTVRGSLSVTKRRPIAPHNSRCRRRC